MLATVTVLTALAWIYLIHVHGRMAGAGDYAAAMRAMGMAVDQPWTVGDARLGFVMWTVMMTGMMAPAAAPTLQVMAGSAVNRGESSWSTVLFAFGYFAAWTAFSALATLAQWFLHETALLTPSMTAVSARGAGIALVVAGLYQLTPEKRACLIRCRNPIDFLMTAWRPGLAGAFRMGLHHGAYCVGCCWALMIVLFGVGVMNLAWVAAISVLVLFEKAGWGGLVISRVSGVALILFGAYSAL